MNDLELSSQANVENTTVVETVEIESIQEAAHEPGTRIEETQNFTEAEAVESSLTAAIAESETATLSPPEMAGTPQESPKIAQDPLTGKNYGGEQNNTPDSNSSDSDATLEAATPGEGGAQAQSGAVIATAKDSGQSAEQVPTSEIDGNDPVYRFDGETPGTTGAVGKENAPGDKVGNGFDPQRLGPENLPQQGKLPVGMGKDGALFPGGGKHLPGSDQGKMPQGSKTNGGGPPVGNYGPGSKGNGKTKYWGEVDGDHVEGSSNQSCQREAVRVSKYSEISEDGNIIVECEDGTQYQLYWEDGGDIEVSKRGMTLDGDQPVPYTGVWSSGEDPDPKTPMGGLDRESGKVYPVLAGGNAKSGGRTPGDKDGDDDSGHFLGDPNLSGSDDYVPPPDDDIPYQQLNQLNGRI